MGLALIVNMAMVMAMATIINIHIIMVMVMVMEKVQKTKKIKNTGILLSLLKNILANKRKKLEEFYKLLLQSICLLQNRKLHILIN